MKLRGDEVQYTSNRVIFTIYIFHDIYVAGIEILTIDML